jgi:hypothetical protein
MLKRISLALAFVVGVPATSLQCDAAPVWHQITGRICMPLADMFTIQQSLDSVLLNKMTANAASINVHHDLGSYTLENRDFALSLSVKRSTSGQGCRTAQPSWTLDEQTAIPAAYVSAFDDAMTYRKTQAWPVVGPAMDSAPSADVVMGQYGLYHVVMLSDHELRKDPVTGKTVLGCGGTEYYWVDVKSGQVRPFDGCVEGGGIQSLPRLSAMPWDGPPT